MTSEETTTTAILKKLEAKYDMLSSLVLHGLFIENDYIESYEQTIAQVRTYLESENVADYTIADVLAPFSSIKFRLYKIDWWMVANHETLLV